MMNSVKNIKTGRLVYREQPDFAPGFGIKNAVLFDCGSAKELEEVTATEEQWQAEVDARQQEQPPTIATQLAEIRQRLTTLEKPFD